MSGPQPSIECPCRGAHLVPSYTYDAPPPGETAFDFTTPYRRKYQHCALCGHWFSHHDMDLSALYSGRYAEATYGASMRATYDRIMALPPGKSDNAGRVARVLAFAQNQLPPLNRPPRLLDIGSGLAVFPARMRAAGWDCTALDPDPRAAEHARGVVGVTAVTGDLGTIDRTALGRFDVITLNKVLEHVDEPVALLRMLPPLLDRDGFIYIEVPDGKAAAAVGPDREEFFVEHHHVFSPASLALMAARAKLMLRTMERLQEPSGKFTLFAFLFRE